MSKTFCTPPQAVAPPPYPVTQFLEAPPPHYVSFLILGKNQTLSHPVHKKNDNKLLATDLSHFCQSVAAVKYLKVILNSIFQYTEENKLLNVNQSGFQPDDSCEYQLLSIVHNIYAGFDQNPPLEVRSSFLDISKVFGQMG